MTTMWVWALMSAAAGGPADSASKDDPLICRRDQAEVGTHMRPKKVCLKKSDWDTVEKHTRNALQAINQRGSNPGRAELRSQPQER